PRDQPDAEAEQGQQHGDDERDENRREPGPALVGVALPLLGLGGRRGSAGAHARPCGPAAGLVGGGAARGGTAERRGRRPATALGAAAGAGAAQLGLGYGLDVVAWTPARDTAGETAWLASLTWVLWLAATSAVLGAVLADRMFAPRSTVDRSGFVAGLVEAAW